MEKISKRKKAYRESNKEQISEYNKKYKKTNRECIRKYRKKHYVNHKEESARYSKEYYENNIERCKMVFNNRKREIKKQWYEFLTVLGHTTCSVCGYNKCFAAIEYHHIDPENKKYEIGRLFCLAFNKYNKEKLLSEIFKCNVLCANCHRERHYSAFG